MPPRKQAKCNPTIPILKKKKSRVDSENKGRLRVNASAQRLLIPQQCTDEQKRGKHMPYVNKNQAIKKEIENEDTFGFSPAYLCECALQNQETSVIKEEPLGLKNKSQINPPRSRKRPHRQKTTVNSDLNGIDEKYCPTLLCESTLETGKKSALGILPKSTFKNSLKNNNKSKSRKQKCLGKTTNNVFSDGKALHGDKKSKNNQVNNYNEAYFPALVCETILRTGDNPAIDPKSKFLPKNNLVKLNNFKKRIQKCSDNTTQKESKQDQECGLQYFYENKSRYKDISVFPVPNNPKEITSKNNVLETNPQKKRRLLVDTKKDNLDEEGYIEIQKFNTAFLCESVISSEETPIPDLSGKNRSSNKSRKIEEIKKTKTIQRNKNYSNSNERKFKPVEKRLRNPTQNKSFNLTTSEDTKDDFSVVRTLERLSRDDSKPHRSENNVIKTNSKGRKNGVNNSIKRRTCKNITKIPKTSSSKQNSCSKKLFARGQQKEIKPPVNNTLDTKEVSHNRKINNVKCVKAKKCTSKNLGSRLSQSDDFSVVSKLDSLKVKICRTRKLKLNSTPKENKNLRNNVKELSIDESSHTQGYNSTVSGEEQSDSEIASVISGYSSDGRENQQSSKQNNPQEQSKINLCEKTLQSQNLDVISKSDGLEVICPENRLQGGSFEEKDFQLGRGENNKLETCGNSSFIEESISGDHKTSYEDESKHTDLNLERSVEESFSFVECNGDHEQNKISSEFGIGDQTSERDPLELHSTGTDMSEYQPTGVKTNDNSVEIEPLKEKEVNINDVFSDNFHSTGTNVSECQPTTSKTNVNTVEITLLGEKEVNFKDVSTDDSVACDLHLECTPEDTETLKSEDQDCGSEEIDIFGIISPCFDIFITSSHERFSLSNLKLINDLKSISKFPSQLKVTHELVDNAEHMCCKEENDSMKTISILSDIPAKISEELFVKCEGGKEKNINTTDIGELLLTSINTDSSVGNNIELEVLSIIDEIISKAVDSEVSSTENLTPEDKRMSHSLQKIQSFELMSKNEQPDNTKNDGDCKREDDKDKLNEPFGEITRGIYYESRESLSKTVHDKVSKEGLNFHEERVLKVLLRRLEDEDIFKVWKKGGVIPLMKRSLLKSSLGHKKAHSKKENLQKSIKKRKDFKCFACKKCFKNRERFWEHRASKCDTLRVFGCGNCNRKYILKKMLDDHKQICLSVKYFRCKECFKLFNSQERLDEHVASKCDTQKVFQCDVCDRSFVFKRLLMIHRTPICTSLRRHRCSTCNQLFDDRLAVRIHRLKDHGIGSLISYLCEFCGKLVSRRHFSNHLNIHFSDENILFRCKICPKVFRSKEALGHHEYCHKDFKPCICADCGKAFSRLVDLKKHVSRQSSSNRCNFCGKVILNQFCFRAHIERHNKERFCNGESLAVEIKEELQDEYSQSIDIGKALESMKSEDIKTELQSSHTFYDGNVQNGQPKETSLTKVEGFKCNLCCHHCPNKEDLLEHITSHQDQITPMRPVLVDKLFKCDICGNGFSAIKNLKRHCQRVHKAPKARREPVKTPTAERPYSCEICKTCFGEMRNLRRHIARMHRKNTESLYPCSFCDEKFSNEVLFKQHTFEHINNSIQCTSLSVNIVEDENKCKNSDAKDFVDMPKKEEPFDLCGISLEEKWDLERHQTEDHLITKNEPEKYTHIKEDEEINLKQSQEAIIDIDVKDERVSRGSNALQVCSKSSPVRNSQSEFHKTKSHACGECGKTFTTKYCKRRHICLHKFNSLGNKIGRDVHPCQECGVVFFDKWRLSRHLLSHNPGTFRCHVCKKCFTSQLKLNVHLLVHGIKNLEQPTFECLTCNKLFPSSKKLEEHSILHTDQNPHQCTKCNRKFTTSYSLKRHNDSVHADKRFLCSYCNMSFVAFSSLNQHVTYVHKKAVSLTEYILRIDDDSVTEAAEQTVLNIHTEGAVDVELQPQVFTNICNMFMGSDMFHASTPPSEKQPGVSHSVDPDQLGIHHTGESKPLLSSEGSITYIQ